MVNPVRRLSQHGKWNNSPVTVNVQNAPSPPFRLSSSASSRWSPSQARPPTIAQSLPSHLVQLQPIVSTIYMVYYSVLLYYTLLYYTRLCSSALLYHYLCTACTLPYLTLLCLLCYCICLLYCPPPSTDFTSTCTSLLLPNHLRPSIP